MLPRPQMTGEPDLAPSSVNRISVSQALRPWAPLRGYQIGAIAVLLIVVGLLAVL